MLSSTDRLCNPTLQCGLIHEMLQAGIKAQLTPVVNLTAEPRHPQQK